jgi:hypothetical protein
MERCRMLAGSSLWCVARNHKWVFHRQTMPLNVLHTASSRTRAKRALAIVSAPRRRRPPKDAVIPP